MAIIFTLFFLSNLPSGREPPTCAEGGDVHRRFRSRDVAGSERCVRGTADPGMCVPYRTDLVP